MLDLFGQEIIEVEKKKIDRTAAERKARSVAMRSEIGELPDVFDQLRKSACEESLVEFGVRYCMMSDDWAGILNHEPSPLLVEYINELQNAIENSGLEHIRLPRGSGKTSWIKIAIVWAVSYGKLKYPVCIAATGILASAILNDVWSIMEFSPEFIKDFPEVSVPIVSLQGMMQRAAGQTYLGERTLIRKTATQINLPCIPGSKASGAIIVSKGAGAAVRGMAKGSLRPDFALLDDIQTREDAMSAATTSKLIAWVMGDVLGLGGTKLLAACLTSTPICANDLSEQLADSNLFPSWKTISYAMVISWPMNSEHWEIYAELWRESVRVGDFTNYEARMYYSNHRAEMDEGAVILDPNNYDQNLELSGLQHVYNLLLRSGKIAFEAEYQLSPPRMSQVMSISAQEVASKCNGIPRYVLPAQTSKVLVFIDVQIEAGLRYSVFAFGPHQTAAVIDYGVYPERGRLVPVNSTEREIQTKVAAGLAVLIERILSNDYVRANNTKTKAEAIWIDHGWQTKVVTRLAALYRNRGFANIYTCKGFASDRYADGTGKNVFARAFNVDMRERDGVQFAAQNSDYWKESLQKGFRGTPLQPGSISLWGKNPSDHMEYAEQVASEVLTDKATSARGLEIYKWTLRVGAVNHFLDASSGCLAMASFYRLWESSDVIDIAVGNSKIPTQRRFVQKKKLKIRSAFKG